MQRRSNDDSILTYKFYYSFCVCLLVCFHFDAALPLLIFLLFSFVRLLGVSVSVFRVRNGPQCHFNLHRILWRKRRRCFLSAHRHRSTLRKSHKCIRPSCILWLLLLPIVWIRCCYALQFTASFNDGGVRAALHSGLYKCETWLGIVCMLCK